MNILIANFQSKELVPAIFSVVTNELWATFFGGDRGFEYHYELMSLENTYLGFSINCILYPFCCPNCPRVSPYGLLYFGSFVLLIDPVITDSFLAIWQISCSSSLLSTLCPYPESSHFSKEFFLFDGKVYLENTICSRAAHCHWVVTASITFLWKGLGYMPFLKTVTSLYWYFWFKYDITEFWLYF